LIFLDTNVFVFANLREYPEHELCLKRLQEIMITNELSMNIIVLVESFHILTQHLEKIDAEYRLESLINSKRIRYLDVDTNTFKEAMRLSREKNVRVNDALICASMKEHGITRILTTNEKDFGKISWIKVENPLH